MKTRSLAGFSHLVPDWHMSNRIEFFNIGSVVTTHVPYKDDLTAKKYYERLVKAGGVGDQPYKRQVTGKIAYYMYRFGVLYVTILY